MEIKPMITRASELFRKYRYVALVLLIGIVLMLLPSNSGEDAVQAEQPAAQSQELTAEQQLSALLSKIDGAGKVEVLLSVQTGAETIFQTDTDEKVDADSSSRQSDTVTVTDADRSETGLVRQVNPPVYLGAVILCQGADRASVKLAVIDAVSKFTGLGADKISVLKMK